MRSRPKTIEVDLPKNHNENTATNPFIKVEDTTLRFMGDGCKRALVKSRAAAMAASVDRDFGIEIFVGNQITVSAIHSDVVSRIQTR